MKVEKEGIRVVHPEDTVITAAQEGTVAYARAYLAHWVLHLAARPLQSHRTAVILLGAVVATWAWLLAPPCVREEFPRVYLNYGDDGGGA